jgi:hypothetical protein
MGEPRQFVSSGDLKNDLESKIGVTITPNLVVPEVIDFKPNLKPSLSDISEDLKDKIDDKVEELKNNAKTLSTRISDDLLTVSTNASELVNCVSTGDIIDIIVELESATETIELYDYVKDGTPPDILKDITNAIDSVGNLSAQKITASIGPLKQPATKLLIVVGSAVAIATVTKLIQMYVFRNKKI